MARTLTLVAPVAAAGQRTDTVLASLVPELSRARAKRLIEGGRVRVDERAARPARRLHGGEHIAVDIPKSRALRSRPGGSAALGLHEDGELLVLDKAAGMVVHPARGSPRSTVVNALLHRYGEGVLEGERLGLVHRLDKATSGCLLVARTEATLAALQGAFRRREVEKTYLALCHGVPPGRATSTPPTAGTPATGPASRRVWKVSVARSPTFASARPSRVHRSSR